MGEKMSSIILFGEVRHIMKSLAFPRMNLLSKALDFVPSLDTITLCQSWATQSPGKCFQV